MSFLPETLDEVVEQKAAPQGQYDLQVTSCQVTETGEKSKHPGSPMLKLSIGFLGTEDVQNITHFISLPFEGDDNASFKLLMLKRFLAMFTIPYVSNIEDLAFSMTGSTANNASVKVEERDGSTYNQLVIPRLRDEPTSGAKSPRRRAA